MKKHILIFAIILLNGFAHAQTINVSLTVPATPFQDADVGAMAFADIDNDGDQDLMITGKGGPIATTLYINDGLGNFTAASGTPFVNVYGGTVGFADVNNDNFIDLLITGVTGSPTPTATLYINNGNGTFSIATTPFTPSREGDFEFGDIDNDNDVDLILTGLAANNLGFTKLYLNNGNGIFSEVVSTPFEQVKWSSVAFIDIENDGDKDVVLAGRNSSNTKSTTLYVNNGNGIFTLNTASSFPGFDSGDIAIADSDNDGDMDILITGGSTSGYITKLYANNGTGTFSEVPGTPFIGTITGATEFADFDNDGDKDILLLGAGNFNGLSALAHIYQNQGSNTFVLSNELIPTYLASLAIADINGDNDLDFIIGGTHFSLPTRNPKLYKNNFNFPVGISGNNQNLPENFSLSQNYPNPFNPATKISYFIPLLKGVNAESGRGVLTKLTIYDLAGREVTTLVNEYLKPGSYDVIWNASYYPSGVYFYTLTAGENRQTRKMILLK